jgi:hypothetical protein
MTKEKTLDEIRREGLAALRERLGVAGMARFLQQFEHGAGDYASERRDWVDKTSMDEIRSLAKARRSGRKIRKTRRPTAA